MYNIEYIINIIAGAIFCGTLLITFFLILINLFKIKLAYQIDKPILFKAINSVLLLGAMIYLVAWAIEPFLAYYSGGEYEQYTIINRFWGSYWWVAIALLLRSILLPQILWVKKIRRSFVATTIIISVWGGINIPMMIVTNRVAGFNLWCNYYWWLINLGQLFIYGLILIATYFILKRKQFVNITLP